MTFEEFKREILNRREDYLPEEMRFMLLKTEKVNKLNSSYDALMIRTIDDRFGISINLNELYEDSQYKGMDEVIAGLRRTILSIEYERISEITDNEDIFSDYSKAKDNLFIRCSNAERNDSFLEDCPYQEMNGLALTAHVGLSWKPETEPDYSAIVTNRVLESWGVTKETLFEDALQNTQIRMPAGIRLLSDLMMELTGGEMPVPGEPAIYVLSNRFSHYGAAAAFYPEMLSMSHEVLGNFYMLPSSVHEWLLVPEKLDMDCSDLEHMVREVNRVELKEADFLSDDVYHFDGEKMELARDYEKRIEKTASMDHIPEDPSKDDDLTPGQSLAM